MNITFHLECHFFSISPSMSPLLRADTTSQAPASISGAVSPLKYCLIWNSLVIKI